MAVMVDRNSQYSETSRLVESIERPLIEHESIDRTSIYPTSGAVSPTITLPERTSHHLKVSC